MNKDMMETLRGPMGLVTDNLLREQAKKALDNIAQQQAMLHQGEIGPGFESGKPGDILDDQINSLITAQPSYNTKSGYWDSIIPNAIGAAASIGQYLDASRQDIKVPDTYAANPYASNALQKLANIRISPYSQIRSLYDTERRAKYGLKNTGGLTAGQKYAANVAQGIGTQGNMAQLLRETQAQNNQYKAAYASAALQEGQAAAQRLQNANQFKEEMTAKAHAAKLQGMQMGQRNLMDYITQAAANLNKWGMFDKMYNLYSQLVDQDRLNTLYSILQNANVIKELKEKETKQNAIEKLSRNVFSKVKENIPTNLIGNILTGGTNKFITKMPSLWDESVKAVEAKKKAEAEAAAKKKPAVRRTRKTRIVKGR